MNKKIGIILAAIFTFFNIVSVNAAMFYEEPLDCAAVYVVNKSTGMPIVEKIYTKKEVLLLLLK